MLSGDNSAMLAGLLVIPKPKTSTRGIQFIYSSTDKH